MSDAQANSGARNGDNNAQGEEPEQQTMFGKLKWFLLMFVVTNIVSNYFMSSKAPSAAVPASASSPGDSGSGAPAAKPKVHVPPADPGKTLYPLWPREDRFSVELSVSDSQDFDYQTQHDPIAKLEDVSFEDDYFELVASVKVDIDRQFVTKNKTMWAHMLVVPNNEQNTHQFHVAKPITQYQKQPKKVAKKNLLSAADSESTESVVDEAEPLIVPFFHPNMSFAFVSAWDAIPTAQTHPAARQHIIEEPSLEKPSTDGNSAVGFYYPIVYNNEFWQLASQFSEINQTTTSLPMQFTIYQMAMWKFQLLSTMDDSLKQQAKQQAAGSAEMEELKRVLLETNPYLLGITVVVSLLHTLFEFLAFKNDISHWRNKKDTIGVSVRTIIANVVMQLITFLYLWDNSDNTNSMVLLTQGMGIFVEAWKVTKAVDITFNTNGKWIEVKDKHELSDTEKKTQEYDQVIFKYLFMVAIPLVLGYAVYSLHYDEHKSWRSFLITTAVQCVYAYGFLLLIPPVYINYRLKSVAHMSGRAMIYKTLNTFIDDLFSFVIKMPWLHRLMTLRDDVIFVIYLYQSWAYRVDHSRINELGQGGADEPDQDPNTPQQEQQEEEQAQGETKKMK